MKKLISKIFTILFIILFTLWLFSDISYAWVDLTVSPIKYEFNLDKWQSETKTIKLFNNTSNDLTIDITIRNIKGTKDNWQPIFDNTTTSSNDSIAKRVVPQMTSFVIKAWTNMDIPFTITVPNSATPGWHYWAVFFNTEKIWAWQIKIINQIWVLIYNDVPWNQEAEGNVNDITIKVSNWWSWGWVFYENWTTTTTTWTTSSIWEKLKDFIFWDDNTGSTSTDTWWKSVFEKIKGWIFWEDNTAQIVF